MMTSHTVERKRCPNGCRKAWRVYLVSVRQDPSNPDWKIIPDYWAVECKECGYNG